jgi:hypothetical protein
MTLHRAIEFLRRPLVLIRCRFGVHRPRVSIRVMAMRSKWPARSICVDCGRGLVVHPSGYVEESEA